MMIQRPAGVRGRGDPAGAKTPRRLPGPPLERKSTNMFKRTYYKTIMDG
jgi:hypothetical protein